MTTHTPTPTHAPTDTKWEYAIGTHLYLIRDDFGDRTPLDLGKVNGRATDANGEQGYTFNHAPRGYYYPAAYLGTRADVDDIG